MKDSRELRAFLLEKMVGVGDGAIAVDQAKAICNLSQQVYNSLNIEIKMAQAKGKLGSEAIPPVSFDASDA